MSERRGERHTASFVQAAAAYPAGEVFLSLL